MRRALLIGTLLALCAAPAHAADPPTAPLNPATGVTIEIGPGCAGASVVSGRLVRVTGNSVVLAVEDGKGAASAFMGAQLLLPVASNATGAGLASLQRGQQLQVEVTSCPNAEHSTMSMVAGRIVVAQAAGDTKTIARQPVKKHAARPTKR